MAEVAKRAGSALPYGAQSKRRYLKRLRRHLGFAEWPQDILRHTAASMMLARDGDAGKVAEQLGNSAKILRRDYKALVTVAQQREFWQIRPKAAQLELGLR